MQDFIKQEELTAEQSQIINLKSDSNYVIQGEPEPWKNLSSR